MATTKILIVEDEPSVRIFLTHLLKRDQHDVSAFATGEAALPHINPSLDVAILDLNLGRGMSGLDVLAVLREHAPETMVILLTGQGTLETAVAAMRQGAHDYLCKPCQAHELRESIEQALHKRYLAKKQNRLFNQLEQNLVQLAAMKGGAVPTAEAVPPSPPVLEKVETILPATAVQFGSLRIDTTTHLAHIHGQPLELSPLEFNLLHYLAQKAPQVATPQEILRAAQGYDASPMEASDLIRSHIYRLRQKVRDLHGSDVRLIRTVRGVGYTLYE